MKRYPGPLKRRTHYLLACYQLGRAAAQLARPMSAVGLAEEAAAAFQRGLRDGKRLKEGRS